MNATPLRLCLSLALGLALTGCYAASQAPVGGQKAMAAKATPANKQKAPQILVKFKDPVRAADMQAFRAAFGTRNVGLIAGLNVYVEEVTSREPLDKVLRAMNASPQVEYAEPNGEVGILN